MNSYTWNNFVIYFYYLLGILILEYFRIEYSGICLLQYPLPYSIYLLLDLLT